MGRPLNKKFFGDYTDTLATGEFRIRVSAWFDGEGAAEDAFIVRQRSNLKYQVSSLDEARVQVCKLVNGEPAAEGEMRVLVTAAGAATQAANVTVTIAGGEIDAVTVVDGGFGYLNGGDGTIQLTAVDGGNGAIDLTVIGGVIDDVNIVDAGSGYTDGLLDISGDLPTLPTSLTLEDYARIINSRVVKTWEGRIFAWPETGAPRARVEADIDGEEG